MPSRGRGPGGMVTIGRCAVLTEAHNGRAPCHYCGPCHRRLHHALVLLERQRDAAGGAGDRPPHPAAVHASCTASRMTSGAAGATGVRVIDGQTKHALEFQARVIFLCASTIESARILLNSGNGFANSSGQVGKNLMDHIMGGGAKRPDRRPADRDTIGNRPNGIYVPRFRNVGRGGGPKSKFLRGYGFQGGGGRSDWGRGVEQAWLSAPTSRSRCASLVPGASASTASAKWLPKEENVVEIDKAKVDAWGIPVARISCAYGRTRKGWCTTCRSAPRRCLPRPGAHDIQPFTSDNPPGLVITRWARRAMGKDSKTSVLNAHNQCWDVPNLFVTDGAAWRRRRVRIHRLPIWHSPRAAAAYAVDAMKRREL